MSGTEAVPECSNTATVPSVLHACLGQAMNKTTALKGLAEAQWCCKGCTLATLNRPPELLMPKGSQQLRQQTHVDEEALHFLGVVA